MYICTNCGYSYGHDNDFHDHLVSDHAFTDDEADAEIEKQDLDDIPEGYL